MFKVILTNGHEDCELFFRLKNTVIAEKWFRELKGVNELYEDDRFSNWGSNKLIDDLNYHISVINNYDKIINYKVDTTVTQKDLNYLHKFFEKYRGEISQGTEWFTNAPYNIKNSLEKFNVLIHQLESSLRTKNKHPTLVVTFKNCNRLNLETDDYKYFTYRWKQGTVYINYCQVGKTVLDAYKDNDRLNTAIRPQIYYSADFMIKFGPTINIFVYMIRSVLIKFWLMKNRFNFPHKNLGMIPVAELITRIDKKELLKFNKVKKVVCLK